MQLYAAGNDAARSGPLGIICLPAFARLGAARAIPTVAQQNACQWVDVQRALIFVQPMAWSPSADCENTSAGGMLLPSRLNSDKILDVLKYVLLYRISRVDGRTDFTVDLVPRAIYLLFKESLQRTQIFIEVFPAVISFLHPEMKRSVFLIAVSSPVPAVAIAIDQARSLDNHLEHILTHHFLLSAPSASGAICIFRHGAADAPD